MTNDTAVSPTAEEKSIQAAVGIKIKSQAQNLRELRDMKVCPECGKVQSTPREAGDDCENEDCECYVVHSRKYNYWTNPNWG